MVVFKNIIILICLKQQQQQQKIIFKKRASLVMTKAHHVDANAKVYTFMLYAH